MRWIVGIEDTAIGVPLAGTGRTLDEALLTEHDRRWREDLDLAAASGADAIRYGLPWYRVNPAPDTFDWRFADAAIDHASQTLGLDVIVDLVHYGVPSWLPGGFADPGYPDAVARWAGAVAARFQDRVFGYTPLNEPSVTAAFCGEFGGWPPYLTGADGWTTVALAVAAGIQQSISAIVDAVPQATIVHVEAAKLVRPGPPASGSAIDASRMRAWLPTDLAMGMVDEEHPMWGWLLRHGAQEATLRHLARGRPRVDVMGVNFYPQYSARDLVRAGDATIEVAGGGTGEDLVRVLRDYADRYGLPVAVTETSFDGPDEARTAWAVESVEAVAGARRQGLDVWGYTWWPLFDFVDWGYSTGDIAFEDFQVRIPLDGGGSRIGPLPSPGLGADASAGVGPWLRRMGLWRLDPDVSGLRRMRTPTADAFADLVRRARS